MLYVNKITPLQAAGCIPQALGSGKERNMLTLKHRNSMLFIRSNMHMQVKDFPAEEMADGWYEDGHLMADDPIVPPSKLPKKKSISETSRLFSKTP